VRPEQMRVLRQQPAAEFNWGHGMVSHVAWLGSYALYQIRLDSGLVINASVPGMTLAQADAPGIDEEVFVSWANDSATVLPT